MKVTPPLLSQFYEYIEDVMGLHFLKENASSCEKKLEKITQDFGFNHPLECIDWIMKTPLSEQQMAVFAKHLTIGETYFFRDARTFKCLKEKIFPSLIKLCQHKKKLRIWCSACSSGEEPYSIAILLHNLLLDIKEWNISIIATDVNIHALNKAKQAIYNKWSFRSTPPDMMRDYFIKNGEQSFTPISKICEMVNFTYLNLVEDTYPDISLGINEIDIIFCNNVLIYFSQPQIDKTIGRLTNSLTTGGWLIVTPIETPYVNDQRLKMTMVDGMSFFQKGDQEQIQVSFKPVPLVQSSAPLYKEIQEISQQIADVVLPKINFYEECKSLYATGNYDQMIFKLEQKLFPHQGNLCLLKELIQELILLVYGYVNQGKFANARLWCEIGLNADKLNPYIYSIYAMLLQAEDCDHEAIAALNQALYLNPDLIVAHFMLGDLTRRLGKLPDSERHFRNALRLLQNMNAEAVLPGTDNLYGTQEQTEILYRQKFQFSAEGGITAGKMIEWITGGSSCTLLK